MGPAQCRYDDGHVLVEYFLNSGFPQWGRCSQSVCSPVAVSAGGSQSSWERMWGMSSSPHSSCLSPPCHVVPGGYHSCSISFSCLTSSGYHRSTPPPCAGKNNWTDSIKQCSIFTAKRRAPFLNYIANTKIMHVPAIIICAFLLVCTMCRNLLCVQWITNIWEMVRFYL